MRVSRCLILAARALGLTACGGGQVRRVSEPAASIQQLSVTEDGSWNLQLRLQNYSSIPMRFDQVELDVETNNQSAGHLSQAVGIDIGPESADVVELHLQPSSMARLAVADALASQQRLPYRLSGQIQATPEDKKQRQFDLDSRDSLSPAPGLNGVLR